VGEKTMKETLLTLALSAAGVLFPNYARAEEKKPEFNLWLETYNIVDRNSANLWVPRIELSKDKSNILVAEHSKSQDYHDTKIGGRISVDFGDVVKGKVGVYGRRDTDKNHGLGVEVNGTIAKFFQAGASLEATNNSQLEHVFVGKQFPIDLTAKLGYFRKDKMSHLEGVLSKTFGQYFLGVGGNINEEGKGKINICFARYAKKKGEGIGGRAWAQYDFDGNYHIQGIFTIGNNFTLPSLDGLMDVHDGGLNDPKLFKNMADFRPSIAPYRGKTVAIKFAVDKARGSPAVYSGEAYFNFGNLGPVKNIRVGGAWIHEDISNADDVVKAFIGCGIGPITAQFVEKLQSGQKPIHEIWIGAGMNDCIDYVRKHLGGDK
jgi:hypothetical protein